MMNNKELEVALERLNEIMQAIQRSIGELRGRVEQLEQDFQDLKRTRAQR